jgi:hypothetical protein
LKASVGARRDRVLPTKGPVTARIALAAAAMLVFGACLYLFLEVRSKPAEAQGSAPPAAAKPDTPVVDEAEPETAAKIPAATRVATVSEAVKPPVRVRPSTSAKAAMAEPIDPATIEDGAIIDPDGKPGYQLDRIMAEANRAYDRMELDDARAIAQRVLKKLPTNVRMLRIMVSAACHEGDQVEAQKHFNLLPERDREQMKTRCMRNQVTFTDPPAK